jgi:hypothetical protein
LIALGPEYARRLVELDALLERVEALADDVERRSRAMLRCRG